MPTFVSHGIVAIVASEVFSLSKKPKFWVLSLLCSVLPDVDVILLYLGVPYGHVFGHRGFTHSILFVFLVALLIVIFGFRETKRLSKNWWALLAYFFTLGLSHIILDAMTVGGLGVGFFIPFDSGRYLFPFRPIRASPFRLMYFFSSEGKRILVSEAFWIWIPLALTMVVVKFVRLRGKKK